MQRTIRLDEDLIFVQSDFIFHTHYDRLLWDSPGVKCIYKSYSGARVFVNYFFLAYCK
jgi:membrane-bound acyltransferase YfiQ involved in biofilm formation